MYQPYLDELTAFATGEPFKEEVLKAKAQYFAKTGEVFEDDRQFEMRLVSFLDHYLFDRPLGSTGKSPAQFYCEENVSKRPPEEAAIFRDFAATQHGIYEVGKIKGGRVRLLDLFANKKLEVFERREPAGLEKGDLIEARVIPFKGHLMFSRAFGFHPRDAKKLILKEVKRFRKQGDRQAFEELIFTLAKLSLKVDRYRNIAVKDIYRFEPAK